MSAENNAPTPNLSATPSSATLSADATSSSSISAVSSSATLSADATSSSSISAVSSSATLSADAASSPSISAAPSSATLSPGTSATGAENNTYTPHSPRARAARFRKLGLSRPFGLLIKVCIIALLVLAVVLFWQGLLWAWIVLAVADLLIIFAVWLRAEAAHIPIGPTEDINDLLSGDVLVILAATGNLAKLSERLATQTLSGQFLAVRLGMVPDLLAVVATMLEQRGVSLEQILAQARQVRQATDSEQINGGTIIVAMLECLPEHEELLHRLNLELSDLYEGIVWYSYLHGRVRSAHKPRHSGGIARDLAFGYIPTLERFGRNVSLQVNLANKTLMHSPVHQQILTQMEQTFASGGRQNVALIGPDGSGRSTIVRALAEELLDADSDLPRNLKFRQIFQLDASALISAAGNNHDGKLEALLTRIFNEAYAAKNIIIWLDNAHLFFEEGTGAVDVTNLLLPVVEAGNLRLILTLEQQKFLQISAKNAALANALNKIYVQPTDKAATLKVLEDQVPFLEYQYHVVYDYRALREAYNLSERYVHDVEMPGRALNLLEAAANFASQKLVTAASVRQAVESTVGVKLQATQTQDERDKLLNLEDQIHERMVDQAGAVRTVADALRRAAAGVRNTQRPIGTFLFLGPTGVGKTELAKALSEVYFGGEKHIVRLDLNEYVTADDVNRLIADGAVDELSLTAQVMKQPFAVVLLDEIEKAHPQVLTTLLQMLDEGILRDINNREVSFRDTIVVATSNAGAQQIREAVGAGVDLAQIKDQLTNQLITSGEFKPEFLNRFDEICIFQPLGKAELLQIVDLILASVNRELAAQKVQVSLTPEAKELLVERGYDPQLGARPLRRVVQQTVENIVAQLLLSQLIQTGSSVEIDRAMLEAELER